MSNGDGLRPSVSASALTLLQTMMSDGAALDDMVYWREIRERSSFTWEEYAQAARELANNRFIDPFDGVDIALRPTPLGYQFADHLGENKRSESVRLPMKVHEFA